MIIISENKLEDKRVEELVVQINTFSDKYQARAIKRDDGYAMTVWSVADVKEKHDMSDENARQFLEDYERRLAESAISGGWDFIDYADVSDYTEEEDESN